MNKKTLQIEQLESKMKHFSKLTTLVSPPTGWVRATRLALGISLQQMAKQLKISKQRAQELEQREKEGAITIKSLSDAAEALNMKLVYGFVPLDGSIDNLIERKAKELATQIVLRTSNSMKLENQKNSEERIKKAIKDRTVELKKEIPKSLWD